MTEASDARIARVVALPVGIFAVAFAVATVAAAMAVVVALAPHAPNDALTVRFGERIAALHGLVARVGTETFTAAGVRVYAGWLGALLGYWSASSQGGAVLGGAAFFFALAASMQRTLSRGGDGIALVLVAVLATVTTLPAITQVTTSIDWLLLSLALLLAERADARSAYGLAGLTLVWCNVDAQGVLAAGLLLVATVAARIEDRGYSLRTKALVRASALAVLATFLTPAFWELPARAATYLRIDPAYGALHPWLPPSAPFHAYSLAFIPLVIAAALFGTWRRERAFDGLLVVAATFLAVLNVAFLPWFAFAAAPVIVPSALAALRIVRRPIAAAPLAGFAAAAIAVAVATFPARVHASAEQSVAARTLAVLVPDGRDHRVFCAATDTCSALSAAGDPHVRVFMDGRDAAYPAHVVRDQLTIARVRPGWRARLAAWRIDAIVVGSDRQLSEVLELLPQWHRTALSDGTLLFVRKSSGG